MIQPPETALTLYPLGTAPAIGPNEAMIRRELLDRVGGFEEEFTDLYEDQAFFAKVYLTEPIYSSTRVWVDYRQHDASCVSRVHANGSYAARRRQFLAWLRDWIDNRERKSAIEGIAAVRSALQREFWKLDHPRAAKVITRLQQLAGR